MENKVGSNTMPEVIWTLPIEKVKNENGKDEYIISIPEKLRKYLKLKNGDKLFWGERAKNCCEVRKATKDELQQFKIDFGQDNAMRQARQDKFAL
jgi:bifunctional DNA-binding transcriptional regulator/antitoxin component of YhaV-PrlF toxin-antitoxin module